MITVRQKQPSEALAYDFDFNYDGGIPVGQAIASVTSITATNCGVVSGSSSLSVSATAFSGRVAQAILDGGTHGESYKLTAKVLDTVAQRHELDGILEVIDQ